MEDAVAGARDAFENLEDIEVGGIAENIQDAIQ